MLKIGVGDVLILLIYEVFDNQQSTEDNIRYKWEEKMFGPFNLENPEEEGAFRETIEALKANIQIINEEWQKNYQIDAFKNVQIKKVTITSLEIEDIQ